MWMYSAGDADKGPVEFAVIESLVRTGHLDPESTVWTDGWDEWKEIRDVPALAVFLTSPTGLSRAQEGAPDAGRASLPGEVAVGAGAWFIAAGLFIYIGLRVGAMIGLLPPSVADDPELGATLTYFWLISVPVPFVLGVALVVQGALLIAGRQRGTVGPGVFAMIAGGAYAVALVLLGTGRVNDFETTAGQKLLSKESCGLGIRPLLFGARTMGMEDGAAVSWAGCSSSGAMKPDGLISVNAGGRFATGGPLTNRAGWSV